MENRCSSTCKYLDKVTGKCTDTRTYAQREEEIVSAWAKAFADAIDEDAYEEICERIDKND